MLKVRTLLVGSLTVVLVATASAQATAVGMGAGGSTDVGCSGSGCTVGAGSAGRNSSGGSGDVRGERSSNGGSDSCTYTPQPNLSSTTAAALGGQPGGSGAWYLKSCGNASNGLGTFVWLATPPAVSPEVLARQARSRLDLPPVVVQVNPAGTALVNVPTWLFLGGGWQPQSATASVPGVSVTATAAPTVAVWDLGDGATVTCRGPGTPWRPGMDAWAASPDCGHTFRVPSIGRPGEVYRITVTVSWSVTWAGGGQSGTIPGLTSTGSTTLRVAESQTVITR